MRCPFSSPYAAAFGYALGCLGSQLHRFRKGAGGPLVALPQGGGSSSGGGGGKQCVSIRRDGDVQVTHRSHFPPRMPWCRSDRLRPAHVADLLPQNGGAQVGKHKKDAMHIVPRSAPRFSFDVAFDAR